MGWWGDFSGRRNEEPWRPRGDGPQNWVPGRGAGLSAVRKSGPQSGRGRRPPQCSLCWGPGPAPSPSLLLTPKSLEAHSSHLCPRGSEKRKGLWAPAVSPASSGWGCGLVHPWESSGPGGRAGTGGSCCAPRILQCHTYLGGAPWGLRAECVCSQKVCTLSTLIPAPGAGSVTSPTAWGLAEDPRHGKP